MRPTALVLLVALAGCSPPGVDRSSRAQAAAAPSDRIVFPVDQPAFLPLPNGGRQPIRSLLNVPTRLHYGEFVWNDKGVREGPRWIRVDLERQMLSIFRGSDEIGTAVILYGADKKPTPRGRFTILAKMKDHRSSLYDAVMPYTMQLTGDGVAIHGSNVREGAASHGCVGVPTEFARHLFAQVKVGDPVTIS